MQSSLAIGVPMNEVLPLVSIITASYNRGHLLTRTYLSLCSQSCLRFSRIEWIVVDDGSDDDTKAVLDALPLTASLEVHYLRQTNQGKHRALNRGVMHARGEFVGLLDSDDELLPDALTLLLNAWRDIPPEKNIDFVGVTGRCRSVQGELIGTPIRHRYLDATYQVAHIVHRLSGERWGIQRREVLLRHPFPHAEEERTALESSTWRAIGGHYKTRYVDDIVRIYHTDHGDRISNLSFHSRAAGFLAENMSILDCDVRYLWRNPLYFARCAAISRRAALHERVSLGSQLRTLRDWRSRTLLMVTSPVAYAYYRRDRAER